MTKTSDICQNCDDASPRFFVRSNYTFGLLISPINDEGSTGPPTAWPNQTIVVRFESILGFFIWGDYLVGPMGSPTAWKNKRPRSVAVLIPAYNACKICDDASPSYFRRNIWKSLFWHLSGFLDVGFGSLTLVTIARLDLMETPNCWYDQDLWYMSKLRWRKS